MLFVRRNSPSFLEPRNLQDQASASTVHREILFQSHETHLQIGIRFLWRTICCSNVLTPCAGSSRLPAKLNPLTWKSAIHLPLVPSTALVCFDHDWVLVVASLHTNEICSDYGSHTPSCPSDYWICLHLGDSPARRSHCRANHEMLSWWHDGLANFVHTGQLFYTLVEWDFLASQHLLDCKLFQKNLPATYRSAQESGATNIERLPVSMSVLQSQLDMQEAVKTHEDDSTLQKCFKQVPWAQSLS